MRATLALLAVVFLATPTTVFAGEPAPETLVSPDGATTWSCQPRDAGLVCTPNSSAGAGTDLRAEVEDLRRRMAALEDQMAEMKDGRRAFTGDDERELDRFLAFSDKAVRRFFGIVQDLKKDLDEENRL